MSAPNADAVAISKKWLVWRARHGNRDVMKARNISDPGNPGRERRLDHAGGAAQLGRPSIDGNRVVYAHATRRANRIVMRVLRPKRIRKRTVLRSDEYGLSNPSLHGKHLAYVQHARRSDRLKFGKLKRPRKARVLLSRSPRTLWSTAITNKRVYVTVIRGTGPSQRVISVKR